MYESKKEFFEFVNKRTLTSVEKWSETLNCKIIHVDDTKKILDNV